MHNKLSEQLMGQGLAGTLRLTETGQEITLNFPAGSQKKHVSVTLGPVSFEAEIHLAINGDTGVDDPNDLALVIRPLVHVASTKSLSEKAPPMPKPIGNAPEITQVQKDVADLPPPTVEIPVQVEQVQQVAVPPPVAVQNVSMAPATNSKKKR